MSPPERPIIDILSLRQKTIVWVAWNNGKVDSHVLDGAGSTTWADHR